MALLCEDCLQKKFDPEALLYLNILAAATEDGCAVEARSAAWTVRRRAARAAKMRTCSTSGAKTSFDGRAATSKLRQGSQALMCSCCSEESSVPLL